MSAEFDSCNDFGIFSFPLDVNADVLTYSSFFYFYNIFYNISYFGCHINVIVSVGYGENLMDAAQFTTCITTALPHKLSIYI